MTIQLIQGFEQILPTTEAQKLILSTEFAAFLGISNPTNTTDWFLDSDGATSNASGPMIIDSDARIDGQSLRIRRPNSGASHNPSFNGAYAVELGRTYSAISRANIGFAVKYSKGCEVSIPLLQFMYDNTEGLQEQASVWVSPAGAMFFSSVAFDIADTNIITPAVIAGASTATGTFNFEVWQYIEIEIDYTGTSPAARIYVDGMNVLESNALGLRKLTGGYVTKTAIINPQNTYFEGDEYDMYFDDIYTQYGNSSPVLGPQHIVLLQPISTTSNDFAIVGAETTVHETLDGLFDKSNITDYVENAEIGDAFELGLADDPGSIVSITAIGLGIIANVDAGITQIQQRITDGVDTINRSTSVTYLTPRLAQGIYTTAPDGTSWTVAKLNATSIGVEVV